MPFDPRLNCAAEICCPPPAARAALVSLLQDLGADAETAELMAHNMAERGISFAPSKLMLVIAELAEHPNAQDAAQAGG